jgi:hypothetical protein
MRENAHNVFNWNFSGVHMGTQDNHKMKSLVKRNLNLAILSWGVLSSIAVIGFLMERFPYQGDNNLIFFGLVLVAIVLLGNFILHMRGFILGINLAVRNKAEGNDPAITGAAMIITVLGIVGAIISVFLFLGW